jgi:hypothetical protein
MTGIEIAEEALGRVKQGRGTILGNAGEHYVLAELLRHDIIAGLTPRNTAGLDILATTGEKSLSIRVKTKSSEARGWVWMAKGEPADATIFVGLDSRNSDDLVALVDIPDEGPPAIYLVQTHALDSFLKRRHQEWLDPSKMRRLVLGHDLDLLRKEYGVSWATLRAKP